MKITIPNFRPMSLNTFYSGKHWSVRAEEAQLIHNMVRGYIKPEYYMFDRKVDITITIYFKNRPYDSDNIFAKLFIDGLKGRIISNDTMEFVGSVTTRSLIDKLQPRVEIEIL